jgi:hypothetical protein
MKGVCWGENLSKCSESLTEILGRLLENQGTDFILHFSFFIIKRPSASMQNRYRFLVRR